jgi:hypothetical protein
MNILLRGPTTLAYGQQLVTGTSGSTSKGPVGRYTSEDPSRLPQCCFHIPVLFKTMDSRRSRPFHVRVTGTPANLEWDGAVVGATMDGIGMAREHRNGSKQAMSYAPI